MTLNGEDRLTALELLDSLPVPERCLNAEPGAPDGGHAFVLPVAAGKRCMYCRTLRPGHQLAPVPDFPALPPRGHDDAPAPPLPCPPSWPGPCTRASRRRATPPAAAAQVGASALIQAADGAGTIHRAWRGEGPDSWCLVTAPGFKAHLLESGHGDRAEVAFIQLTAETYERLRDRVLEDDECPHDLECECMDEPWPSVAKLRSSADDFEIVSRSDNRGFAGLAFNRVSLTLWDEAIPLVYSWGKPSTTA